MTGTYPARIAWSEEDRVFGVDFPDLGGCLTYGSSLEEAKAMASEALSGYLESLMDGGLPLPDPSPIAGKEIFPIEPEPSIAFALWLRSRRRAAGLTPAEVADRLGLKLGAYEKLESPSAANPTLRLIKRMEKLFGEEILLV